MDNKKIGIVTVLYNSEPVLEDFFRTLNEQTYKNFIFNNIIILLMYIHYMIYYTE